MKMSFLQILVLLFVGVSCSCPPRDPIVEHEFGSFEQSFVIGLAGKKLRLEGPEGKEYFIQMSTPISNYFFQSVGDRDHGGMFCADPLPHNKFHQLDMEIQSDIPLFNWNKVSFVTTSTNGTTVVLSSQDSIKRLNWYSSQYEWSKVSFVGTISDNDDHVGQAKYDSLCQVGNLQLKNVNVVISDSSLNDSLFWKREWGFVKFVSKDGTEYILKH